MASQFDDNIPVQQAASILGNGSNSTVQTTVPFALWCAADFRKSYSDTIWQALEGQGDCDTICAIVGGIAAVRVGFDLIPAAWKESCEPLPQWIFDESLHSLAEEVG